MQLIEQQFRKQEILDGKVILIDKPIGWSSFDVVNKVRLYLKHQLKIEKLKIGHAGTLDPLATGLLLLATGRYTKKIPDLQSLAKIYEGRMELGATTASYDLETPISKRYPLDNIFRKDIENVIKQFIGNVLQKPPIYSAIKKDGKRLYQYARKGEIVEVKPREVYIHRFEIKEVALPEVSFEIECSKGTYIRSLVHDVGSSLGCGAHLTELRRKKIGDYTVESALRID